MDLRSLPKGLSSTERCAERLKRAEQALGVNLSALRIDPGSIGHAEERNCEQMFGSIPLPLGYAGPLSVRFSTNANANAHSVFRATKIAPDHPALAGRDLTPLDPQPPLGPSPDPNP